MRPRCPPEAGIGEGLLVVRHPDEGVAADQLVAEQAEIDRIADRDDEEHDQERGDETPAGP